MTDKSHINTRGQIYLELKCVTSLIYCKSGFVNEFRTRECSLHHFIWWQKYDFELSPYCSSSFHFTNIRLVLCFPSAKMCKMAETKQENIFFQALRHYIWYRYIARDAIQLWNISSFHCYDSEKGSLNPVICAFLQPKSICGWVLTSEKINHLSPHTLSLSLKGTHTISWKKTWFLCRWCGNVEKLSGKVKLFESCLYSLFSESLSHFKSIIKNFIPVLLYCTV